MRESLPLLCWVEMSVLLKIGQRAVQGAGNTGFRSSVAGRIGIVAPISLKVYHSRPSRFHTTSPQSPSHCRNLVEVDGQSSKADSRIVHTSNDEQISNRLAQFNDDNASLAP
jgi:hypothetical protein